MTPTTATRLAAFTAWLERAGTSPHTRRAYLRHLDDFARFVEGSGRELAPTLDDEHERTFAARDWRTHLKHTRRLSPASVNQALAALHTFCQFAGLSTPDVQREDLPQLAPRALNEAEQKRLLRAIERTPSARDKAIAYTLFYTGLRIAEVAGLDLSDVIVSDRRGKVIVRRGKGDRQRETPLHPVAREALRAWLRERRERWGNAAQSPGDTPGEIPCFVSYQGTRLSTRSMDKLMDHLGQEAAIEGLSAHVLRHTFTTNLIRGGQDLVLVAELTGHARLETVRRYSLPTEQDKERAVAALPTDA